MSSVHNLRQLSYEENLLYVAYVRAAELFVTSDPIDFSDDMWAEKLAKSNAKRCKAARKAFDRLMRKIKADAWDEGYNSGLADHDGCEYRPNPCKEVAE